MIRSKVHLNYAMCALLFVLVAFGPTVGHAQLAKMEAYSYPSVTLSDQQFLLGEKNSKPVTIARVLRIPKPGNDRLPAVLLVHGSGGISSNVTDWEQELNAMGVATFIIDGFTPRGIDNVRDDQSQLSRLAMIYDVYRALELLAKHPRIDPARIAVMGFSRGGETVLRASMKRFQRMYGPTDLEFAVYIAFYPNCATTYRDEENVSDRPIRLFHGTADDYAPFAPTRAYSERLKANGKDVQLTAYEGAFHVFDWQAAKKPVRLEKDQTNRRCQAAEVDNGILINVKSKEPFTWADPCVERGVTLAYDEKAYTDAKKAIKEFVTTILKP
jgi:dienelactone hydrolase